MARWFDKDLDKAKELLVEAKTILENLYEEADVKFENYPENLHYSETGDRMEQRMYVFEEANENIDDIVGELENI